MTGVWGFKTSWKIPDDGASLKVVILTIIGNLVRGT